MSKYMGAFTTLLLLVVIGVAIYAGWKSKPAAPGLMIEPVSFKDLPGWSSEQPSWQDALDAFQRSCAAILPRAPDEPFARRAVATDIRRLYGRNEDWQKVCRNAPESADLGPKSFFETYFDAVIISENREKSGLFTGYYEPVLNGSRDRQGPFQTPLLARPEDLVMVELGDFRDALAGQRIAGRVLGGRLQPFESRAEIEAVDDWTEPLAIVWVDNAIDAFFLHIQGSGRVALPDGQTIRVNYDGQNGHPYTAIGRTLIDRGAIAREDVSLQSIAAWLEANPDDADEVMNTNASYIFFREIDVENPALGPPGAQGIALTPLASIAVDRLYYPLGTPVWLDISMTGQILDPADETASEDYTMFNNLTIAQDTGGAIKGVQRADLYWGSGPKAGASAGLMKQSGTMYALIPKGLTSSFLQAGEGGGP